MNSLKEVYIAQLQDSYSACKQSLSVTTELGSAAENKELSQALIDGAQGISEGLEKLQQLCATHDVDPDGHHCKGMEGLVTEAKEHALEEKFGDADARDAMIITQYQRMAHYAIAAYGCLKAFANRLDLDEDGAILNEMLDSCYDGDRRLSDIAMGSEGVNAEAA